MSRIVLCVCVLFISKKRRIKRFDLKNVSLVIVLKTIGQVIFISKTVHTFSHKPPNHTLSCMLTSPPTSHSCLFLFPPPFPSSSSSSFSSSHRTSATCRRILLGDRQKQLEFWWQFFLGIKTIREINATNATIRMDLHAKGFNVIGTIGATSEV